MKFLTKSFRDFQSLTNFDINEENEDFAQLVLQQAQLSESAATLFLRSSVLSFDDLDLGYEPGGRRKFRAR